MPDGGAPLPKKRPARSQNIEANGQKKTRHQAALRRARNGPDEDYFVSPSSAGFSDLSTGLSPSQMRSSAL
jgi:hypothetical protein